MNDAERYLFDLQGFVIVPQALAETDTAEVNAAIDTIAAQLPPLHQVHTGFPSSAKFTNNDPAKGPVDVFTSELLLWGEAIAALPVLPSISRYLTVLLGDEYRLDHCYAILMRADDPHCGVQNLHNGGTPFEPAFRYSWQQGAFDLGLVTITFALVDEVDGAGGFGCIPGSHKSNYPLPAGWNDLSDPRPEVIDVALRAGDAVIFSEALTHGTLRWRRGGQRRALLFKFMPGHLQWAEQPPAIPPMADPRLRRVVRPSYRSGRSGRPG